MDKEDPRKVDAAVTVTTDGAFVTITETTLRELLMACAQAKLSGMAEAHVRSDHHRNWFNVMVELKPNTQESLGYRLISGKV